MIKLINLLYEDHEDQNLSTSMQGKVDKDITLIPNDSSLRDVINAFQDLKNYGSYASNVRTNKMALQKAIDNHFGPSIPSKKKSAEKQRGKPFPIKTKQTLDDFINNYNPEPDILFYKRENNYLYFPKESNPEKSLTKKIIDTVMKSANINYELGLRDSK